MQSMQLAGKKVAVLVTNGFEQVELTEPRKALEQAGAAVTIISPQSGTIRAWNEKDWGDEFSVDLTLDQANADDFHALLLPGGVMNPDHLRMNEAAVRFVKRIFDTGKPVAAICHGPWMLVEADVVRGRTLTSYKSLNTDIINAGGKWVDQEVVTDRGLVTSRNPKDIPAFNQKMIEEFAEGYHPGQEDAAIHPPA